MCNFVHNVIEIVYMNDFVSLAIFPTMILIDDFFLYTDVIIHKTITIQLNLLNKTY